MRVFISSTHDDLVEHRRAVDEALARLSLQSGRMEVFGAGPQAPVEKSLEEVANSDLFVGIYAHRYGFVPTDHQVSITELEYKEALRLGKPVFAFLIDSRFEWKPEFIEGEPGRSHLNDLKRRISLQSRKDTFTSPVDLAYKVATSVGNYLLAQALPEFARRIAVPAATDPVRLENLALLHTSFRAPKADDRFRDGLQYYQFEVIVIAPNAVMERIEYVTYHLEKAWPEANRKQVISDRGSRFKMKELANGTSIVTADISIKGQSEAVKLNRFIDLRSDGPRL
jgi:hypothetical protein